MLRRHIVLLIAIRSSDGDIKPGGPLGAFREEQTMSRHLLPSFHYHRTQHNYTTQTVKFYTYSHPNLSFLQYTIHIFVPHVMWSAQAVRDSKIDHTQRHLSALRVIVQWVGIGTNKHSSVLCYLVSPQWN